MEESFPRGGSSDVPVATGKPASGKGQSKVKLNFLGEAIPTTSKRSLKQGTKHQGHKWSEKRSRRSNHDDDDQEKSDQSDDEESGPSTLKRPKLARVLRTKVCIAFRIPPGRSDPESRSWHASTWCC